MKQICAGQANQLFPDISPGLSHVAGDDGQACYGTKGNVTYVYTRIEYAQQEDGLSLLTRFIESISHSDVSSVRLQPSEDQAVYELRSEGNDVGIEAHAVLGDRTALYLIAATPSSGSKPPSPSDHDERTPPDSRAEIPSDAGQDFYFGGCTPPPDDVIKECTEKHWLYGLDCEAGEGVSVTGFCGKWVKRYLDYKCQVKKTQGCGLLEKCFNGKCCDWEASICGGECFVPGVQCQTCADNKIASYCVGCSRCLPEGSHSTEWTCKEGCSLGADCCGSSCIDTDSDPSNCGGCGDACGASEKCCGGTCTRTDTTDNCGSCGDACDHGQDCCTGACTDSEGDDANCGGCGMRCEGGRKCEAGECRCPNQQPDCHGACPDYQADARNCGGCDHACTAEQACVAGKCICAQGKMDCAGKCVDPQTDAENCGRCGNACTDCLVCVNGACVPPLEPCRRPGGGWGDPHMFTWDGLHYDFQFVGEFVLSTDDRLFALQIRTAPYSSSKSVAAIVALACSVAGTRVEIDAMSGTGARLLVDGSPSGPVDLPNGAKASLSMIAWPDGTVLRVGDRGTHLDIKLDLPNGLTQQGLLGNANGDAQDDLQTRGGGLVLHQPVSPGDWKLFANSWRISQMESLFEYSQGENTNTFTDLTFPLVLATAASLPPDQYNAAETICKAAGVADPVIMQACILDVGTTGNSALAKAAADTPLPKLGVPALYTVTVAIDSLQVDVLSPSGIQPDGSKDGAFDIKIMGPLAGLILLTTDATGIPVGGQQWDTLTAAQAVPAEIGAPFSTGGSTWILGIFENGSALNRPDKSLPPLGAGIHELKIYAPDSGYFVAGRHLRLFAIGTDGSVVRGSTLTY